MFVSLVFFFFQAEDGIRDDLVTGVQTCALPIASPKHRCWMHKLRPASSALQHRRRVPDIRPLSAAAPDYFGRALFCPESRVLAATRFVPARTAPSIFLLGKPNR